MDGERMQQAPGQVTATFPEIEDYLSRLKSKMYWADSKVRDGIVAEMRSHAYDSASSMGERAALASMEEPASVAKRYREIYGYGTGFSLALAAGAAVLAILSVTPLPSGNENPLALVVYPALLLLVAYVAFAGGRLPGIVVGAGALAVRLLLLIPLERAGDFAPFGLLMYVVATMMLPLAGYLAGEARRRWSGGLVT